MYEFLLFKNDFEEKFKDLKNVNYDDSFVLCFVSKDAIPCSLFNAYIYSFYPDIEKKLRMSFYNDEFDYGMIFPLVKKDIKLIFIPYKDKYDEYEDEDSFGHIMSGMEKLQSILLSPENTRLDGVKNIYIHTNGYDFLDDVVEKAKSKFFSSLEVNFYCF